MVFQFSGTPRSDSRRYNTKFDYPELGGKLYAAFMVSDTGKHPSRINPMYQEMQKILSNAEDQANYPVTGLLFMIKTMHKLNAYQGGYIDNFRTTYTPYRWPDLSPEEFSQKAWDIFSLYYDWLIAQIPVDLQKVAKSKFISAAMGKYESLQTDMHPNAFLSLFYPMRAGYRAYMERVGYPITATDEMTTENQRIESAEIMQINIQDLPVTRPETQEMFIEDRPWLVDENQRLQNLVKHYQDISSIAALPRTYISAEQERQRDINLQETIKKYAVPAIAGIVVLRLITRRGKK